MCALFLGAATRNTSCFGWSGQNPRILADQKSHRGRCFKKSDFVPSADSLGCRKKTDILGWGADQLQR
jgi:hypothetical protein